MADCDEYVTQHGLHVLVDALLSDMVRERPSNVKLYAAGWLKRHLRSMDGDALASPKGSQLAPPGDPPVMTMEMPGNAPTPAEPVPTLVSPPTAPEHETVKVQRAARKRTVTMIKDVKNEERPTASPVVVVQPLPAVLAAVQQTALQPEPSQQHRQSISDNKIIRGEIIHGFPPHEPESRMSPKEDGACNCGLGEITKDYRGSDFSGYSCHKSFGKCVLCNHRPADRLCLCCLQPVCYAHTTFHHVGSRGGECALFLNYEYVTCNYKKAFWCEKCGCNTWAFTDAFEAFTDQMASTKGTYLPEPVLDKYFFQLEGTWFLGVAASMQGWRAGQEDAEVLTDCSTSGYLFGVFDGHGGGHVARFVAQEMPTLVKQKDPASLNFRDIFVDVDKKLQRLQDDGAIDCNTTGCTGCVVYYDTATKTLTCANTGDSRAVLCAQGGRVVDLSDDHKIYNPEEETRIKAAGYTIKDGRVEGMLAVPRAFGDFDFKQLGGEKGTPENQAVSVVPEIRQVQLQGDEEFVLIACDGIWDVVSSQQAVDFVRRKLSKGTSPEECVALLLERCISNEVTEDGVGTDNMSVILIILRKNALI